MLTVKYGEHGMLQEDLCMLLWKTLYAGNCIVGGVRKIWSGKLHCLTHTVYCTDDHSKCVSVILF